MGNFSASPKCRYCVENIAYDHCLMNNRAFADYVLVLHGLDEWLVPGENVGADIAADLDAMGTKGTTAFLTPIHLHRFGRNVSRNLIRSSVFRHKGSDDEFSGGGKSFLPGWWIFRPRG